MNKFTGFLFACISLLAYSSPSPAQETPAAGGRAFSIINQSLASGAALDFTYSAGNSLFSFEDVRGNVYIYDIDIREKIAEINGNVNYPLHATLHPVEREIICLLDSRLIAYRTDLRSSRQIGSAPVKTFALSPDGRQVAISYFNQKEIFILDYYSGKQQAIIHFPLKEQELVDKIIYNGSQQGLLILTTGHSIYFCKPNTTNAVTLAINTNFYSDPVCSPNGDRLACIGNIDSVRIINLESPADTLRTFYARDLLAGEDLDRSPSIKTFPRNHQLVRRLAFIDDSTLGIVMGAYFIPTYNSITNKKGMTIKEEIPAVDILFPKDAPYYFVGGPDGTVATRIKDPHYTVFSIRNNFFVPQYIKAIAGNTYLFVSDRSAKLFTLTRPAIDSSWTVNARGVIRYHYDNLSASLVKSDFAGITANAVGSSSFAGARAGPGEWSLAPPTSRDSYVSDFLVDFRRQLLVSLMTHNSTGNHNSDRFTLEIRHWPVKDGDPALYSKEFNSSRFIQLKYDSSIASVDLFYVSAQRATDNFLAVIPLETPDKMTTWPLSITHFEQAAACGGTIYLAAQIMGVHSLWVMNARNPADHRSITLPAMQVACMEPHEMNHQILLATDQGYLYSVDLTRNTISGLSRVRPGRISQLTLNTDGTCATLDNDGAIDFWRIDNLYLLGSLYIIGEKDFIFIDAQGFYSSTKEGSKAIAIGVAGNVYPVQQFDGFYNRPDTVLQELDSAGNAPIIPLYRKFVSKRRTLIPGWTNAQFEYASLPKINYSPNLPSLPALSTPQLDLAFTARDSLRQIDRIDAWVNNVPVFGSQGMRVSPGYTGSKSFSFPITLSSGVNKIEVSATNDNNQESLRTAKWYNYQTPPHHHDLYIIAIGVSYLRHYPQDSLKYPAKDARDIIDSFSRSTAFRQIHPFLLTDSGANRRNILSIHEQLLHTDVDDQVILFFSGHGYLDTATMDLHLCSNDFNLDQRNSTGVRFEELDAILDNIPARKKVLLIDACYSGGADKDDLAESMHNASPGVIYDIKPFGPGISSKLIRQTTLDIVRNLFIDLHTGNGATVIASSGGLSVSYEKDTWHNGLFTYALLNSLKPGIFLSKWESAVVKMVRDKSAGDQVPVIRTGSNEFDYAIW